MYNCEHCKYYVSRHSGKLGKSYGLRKNAWGECHRFPPKENYSTDGPGLGVTWLEVEYQDFCGEFKKLN